MLRGRDFPPWSDKIGVENAGHLLIVVSRGEIQLGERQIRRLVAEFPYMCHSGGIERHIQERAQTQHPNQYSSVSAPPGLVTLDATMQALGCSRQTVDNRINDQTLERVYYSGRPMVTQHSIDDISGGQNVAASGEVTSGRANQSPPDHSQSCCNPDYRML